MCKPNEAQNRNDGGNSRRINTNKAQRSQSINLNDIKSTLDLEALKARDPWMYYSIPAVRNSATLGKAVDMSTIADALVNGASFVVKRRSNISYENSELDMLEEAVARLMAESSGALHSSAEVDDDGDGLFMTFVDEITK
jgi:hypothetical protein